MKGQRSVSFVHLGIYFKCHPNTFELMPVKVSLLMKWSNFLDSPATSDKHWSSMDGCGSGSQDIQMLPEDV